MASVHNYIVNKSYLNTARQDAAEEGDLKQVHIQCIGEWAKQNNYNSMPILTYLLNTPVIPGCSTKQISKVLRFRKELEIARMERARKLDTKPDIPRTNINRHNVEENTNNNIEQAGYVIGGKNEKNESEANEDRGVIKDLEESSEEGAKTGEEKTQRNLLMCSKCLQQFPTRENLRLHSCESLLDKRDLMDDEATRVIKDQDESSVEEAKTGEESLTTQRNLLMCSKCLQQFPTRENLRLHSCESLLDKRDLMDDEGDSIRNKEKGRKRFFDGRNEWFYQSPINASKIRRRRLTFDNVHKVCNF